MDKALLLLQIQKQAMEVASEKELGFHAVNLTKRLVDYRRAVFWTWNRGVRLKNVSGNVILDENSPHAGWMKNLITQEVKNSALTDNSLILDTKNLSASEAEEWLGYAAPNVALIFFRYGEDHEIIGGLWLERETKFKDGEIQILEELAFYYARALVLTRGMRGREFLPLSERLRPYRKYVYAAIILLAFVPVRLTITAPAEVVAVSSHIVSIPFDGVLMDINVRPGDQIEEGQEIARMDVQAVALKADTSLEALRAAKIRLSQLNREVLSNPERKVELSKLLADIKTKEIEAVYAKSQLEKAEIKAPRDGVAIFSDVNDYLGKPVKTGQTIMSIANPAQTELLVRVPLQAMVPLDKADEMSFFPNASPLSSYNADIKSIGYQASEDADGLLTYKVRAGLKSDADIRIGWKGVAKIKGEWSFLGYKILRRPLITLRNMVGV